MNQPVKYVKGGYTVMMFKKLLFTVVITFCSAHQIMSAAQRHGAFAGAGAAHPPAGSPESRECLLLPCSPSLRGAVWTVSKIEDNRTARSVEQILDHVADALQSFDYPAFQAAIVEAFTTGKKFPRCLHQFFQEISQDITAETEDEANDLNNCETVLFNYAADDDAALFPHLKGQTLCRHLHTGPCILTQNAINVEYAFTKIDDSFTQQYLDHLEACGGKLDITLLRRSFEQAINEADFDFADSLISLMPEVLNAADAHGNTALHHAVYLGNKERTLYLLRHGARSDIPNHADRVALGMRTDPARPAVYCHFPTDVAIRGWIMGIVPLPPVEAPAPK